jgi:type I restriction enzyme R subunit
MYKAIVFCEDVAHAERMREALVNVPENRDFVAADHRYVMQITGEERKGRSNSTTSSIRNSRTP